MKYESRSRRARLLDNRGLSRRWAIVIIALVMVASTGVGSLLAFLFPGMNLVQQVRDIYEPPFDGKQVVRILVMGEDNTGQRVKAQGLADTIMLVSIDTTNNHVAAISIPRDSRVNLGEYGGVCKINSALVNGGVPLVKMVVTELTGVQPDYYIKTTVQGFVECVDLVGGVEIDVEKKMDYDDNWGNLHIHLKKGRQLLNGEQAMGYVRFRHDALGDISRMERQQKFLKALGKRILTPANLPKLPSIVASMREIVDTDMSLRDLLELASLPGKIDMDRVKTATLPGTPDTIGGLSYWIPDPAKSQEVIADLFFTPVIAGLPTVEVLNGSGVTGVARRVAEMLRRQGYEIVREGNADSFDYTSSQVIGHAEDVKGLEKLADLVNTTTVKHEIDASSEAEVTVIVGRDYILASQDRY